MKKPGKLYKKLTKYMAAAVLIAVPLYPKFPFIQVPGTFVSIRLEDFLIALSALVLTPFILVDIKKLLSDGIVRAMILYLLIGLVSLLTAIFVLDTVSPSLGLLHWIRRIEYFLPFFLGYYAIKLDKENIQFYLKILLIVIILVFIYGYGQKYYSFPIVITQNAEYSRGIALRYTPGAHINSTFAGHYDLATFLVLVLPTIVILFSTSERLINKIGYLFIWLTGLWLLVNTASRISLVSYMGASALAIILVKKYKYLIVMVIISIIFVNFSTNLIARYNRIYEVTVNRFLSYVDKNVSVYAQDSSLIQRRDTPEPSLTPVPRLEDRSTNIRLDVEWPRAIRAFKKNPLLGTGYSSITLATDNDYLRLLGETGMLGFLGFFLIGLRIVKRLIIRYPFTSISQVDRCLIYGFIGGTAGILVNAVFIDVFEASKFAIVFWLLTGSVVSLISKEKVKGVVTK